MISLELNLKLKFSENLPLVSKLQSTQRVLEETRVIWEIG